MAKPFDIRLMTEQGQTVGGAIYIGDYEKSWRFVPNEPWNTRALRVFVDRTLEDVAGNNFQDLLDQAVSTQDARPSVTTMTVHLESCSGSARDTTFKGDRMRYRT